MEWKTGDFRPNRSFPNDCDFIFPQAFQWCSLSEDPGGVISRENPRA